MFHYFGGKQRLAPRYPEPRFGTIIEPFAGGASYAMLYRDRDVVIIEKDRRVYDVWAYLQRASRADILALPILEYGERADAFGLSVPEQDLIRYHAAPGAQIGIKCQRFSQWNERKREEIAQLCQEIRHWTIINGSYDEAPDIEATWFVDPPYQFGGHRYRCGNRHLDYTALWAWCEDRRGQLVVCENDLNEWLPSQRPIALGKDVQNRRFTEVVYERGSRQLSLEGVA